MLCDAGFKYENRDLLIGRIVIWAFEPSRRDAGQPARLRLAASAIFPPMIHAQRAWAGSGQIQKYRTKKDRRHLMMHDQPLFPKKARIHFPADKPRVQEKIKSHGPREKAQQEEQ